MLLRISLLVLLLAALPLAMSCGDDDDDGNSATGTPTSERGHGTPYPAMILASEAFKDGENIPVEFTCDGGRTSPQLQWTVAPSNARAFVLIVHDPDAPRADGFTHWIVYDIPVGSAHLDPGISPNGQLPDGAKEGKNSAGDNAYAPPCPPRADEAHHYVFTLYALDLPLGLEEGKSKADVEKAMQNHILSQATLTGLYARK
ncbi:MAG TPA: YbhB/YbcL family Raf kinase inhibitor-like protein [Tepidiformaceae bacterium]|nr:YbhB/YbcL family Raf kinase inhibitor-like protein [Tepidiformaceae bacterium]